MKREKSPLFDQKKTISKWTPATHRKLSAQIYNKLLIVIISWAHE